MSKHRGAKGLRRSEIDEAEEMDREMREYEASLPCYMDYPRAGGEWDWPY